MTKEILPAPFIRALKADTYDNGGSDFSVTGLLSPPQRTFLALDNKEESSSIY